MRIFFCELYKLLSKKIFIICLVVALCINAFTLIYSSAENYNDRTKHNNIEYYNSLIKNCNSSKKASEYLKKELDIINERLTENSTDKDALVEQKTNGIESSQKQTVHSAAGSPDEPHGQSQESASDHPEAHRCRSVLRSP